METLTLIIIFLMFFIFMLNINQNKEYLPLSQEEVDYYTSQIQPKLDSSGKIKSNELGTMVFIKWKLPNTEAHEIFDPILRNGKDLTLKEALKKIAEVKKLSGNLDKN